MAITFLVCLIVLMCYTSAAYKINYSIGLNEGDECETNESILGTCQKFSNCLEYFENSTINKEDLKICSFDKIESNEVICCPKAEVEFTNHSLEFEDIDKPQIPEKPSLLDFETCQNEFLKYRQFKINPTHFGKALYDAIIPTTKENCFKLNRLNKAFGRRDSNLESYYCDQTNNKNYMVKKLIKSPKRIVRAIMAYYGNLPKKGDKANMVAIGWTKATKKIEYKCGGMIVTERFIVTAAHCQYHERVEADTVRLGDRYLLKPEDDDEAQQHKILKFIQHPDYKNRISYNDIAMIQTEKEISFDKFVHPSCIGDFDENNNAYLNEWTVAGYGETEENVQSNVLMEIKVNFVSYEECNSTFEHISKLPNGILESQFCVKSEKINGKSPDTCFGDSGSPLQSKLEVEVKDENFNTTYLSTIYQTPIVLGIVSFGLNCGFSIPSVYTKLSYYKSWIRSVIENE